MINTTNINKFGFIYFSIIYSIIIIYNNIIILIPYVIVNIKV